MKLFDDRTAGKRSLIREAREYAAGGDLALHVWQPPSEGWANAPQVFTREAAARRPWAHLMGIRRNLLATTARKLGVRRVVFHGRMSADGVLHVDLCGRPLTKAIALCKSAQPTFDEEEQYAEFQQANRDFDTPDALYVEDDEDHILKG